MQRIDQRVPFPPFSAGKEMRERGICGKRRERGGERDERGREEEGLSPKYEILAPPLHNGKFCFL